LLGVLVARHVCAKTCNFRARLTADVLGCGESAFFVARAEKHARPFARQFKRRSKTYPATRSRHQRHTITQS
jgi:hypothetical protein